MNRVRTVALGLALAAGCATVSLPSNAIVQDQYLDRIDFSSPAAVDFSRLKLCVAENVHNDSVTLQDNAGSFVGRASGTFYAQSNTQTVQGGSVFKYADADTGTVIASGSTTAAILLTKDIVRYEAKATVAGTLVFSHITRAQQSTGSLTNDGFGPVGVWAGARSEGVYAALEAVATKLKGCTGTSQ